MRLDTKHPVLQDLGNKDLERVKGRHVRVEENTQELFFINCTIAIEDDTMFESCRFESCHVQIEGPTSFEECVIEDSYIETDSPIHMEWTDVLTSELVSTTKDTSVSIQNSSILQSTLRGSIQGDIHGLAASYKIEDCLLENSAFRDSIIKTILRTEAKACKINGCILRKVEHSNMKWLMIMDSLSEKSEINHSLFHQCMFKGTSLKDSYIDQCEFTENIWVNSNIIETVIQGCAMKAQSFHRVILRDSKFTGGHWEDIYVPDNDLCINDTDFRAVSGILSGNMPCREKTYEGKDITFPGYNFLVLNPNTEKEHIRFSMFVDHRVVMDAGKIIKTMNDGIHLLYPDLSVSTEVHHQINDDFKDNNRTFLKIMKRKNVQKKIERLLE